MESKILNLQEGLKLASVLHKYVDIEKAKQQTGEEFAYSLFSTMSESDVIKVITLFHPEDSNMSPNDIIFYCVEGMIKSGLFELLATYRQSGFVK